MSPLEIIRKLHGSPNYLPDLLASPSVAEGVEWWAAGDPERLPWAGTWSGRDGMMKFFEKLGALMSYERFGTEEYVADGSAVVTIVSAGGHAIATGRPFESHIVRVYEFHNGMISRIRNFYDTAAYERALARS
jgi:uncharacterized protein